MDERTNPILSINRINMTGFNSIMRGFELQDDYGWEFMIQVAPLDAPRYIPLGASWPKASAAYIR